MWFFFGPIYSLGLLKTLCKMLLKNIQTHLHAPYLSITTFISLTPLSIVVPNISLLSKNERFFFWFRLLLCWEHYFAKTRRRVKDQGQKLADALRSSSSSNKLIWKFLLLTCCPYNWQPLKYHCLRRRILDRMKIDYW